MLNINKNITLNGVSLINGVQAAYMTATISSDGGTGANVNKTITNPELYNSDKAQVRADIAEFEQEVYKVEDELLAAKTLEVTVDSLHVNGELKVATINNKKAGK